MAEQNRENERRRQKREEYAAAFKAAEPRQAVPAEQGAVRRVQVVAGRVCGCGCGSRRPASIATCTKPCSCPTCGTATGWCCSPAGRWTSGCRWPSGRSSRRRPKQMLYGQRAELIGHRGHEEGRIGPGDGGVRRGRVEGVPWRRLVTKPFVFPAIQPHPGGRQALHARSLPERVVRLLVRQVVNGLCDGQPNVLYDRLVTPPPPGDGAGLPGQAAFLAGLDAFRQAGLLHDFEIGKREFIGGHGRTPVLLVQGPPGTGKSYCTAFAVFARLQGAMQEERPYRVFLSCKTHAATDVLLKNVLEVQEKLRELRDGQPEAVRQALRRPPARRAALPGGPERPAA